MQTFPQSVQLSGYWTTFRSPFPLWVEIDWFLHNRSPGETNQCWERPSLWMKTRNFRKWKLRIIREYHNRKSLRLAENWINIYVTSEFIIKLRHSNSTRIKIDITSFLVCHSYTKYLFLMFSWQLKIHEDFFVFITNQINIPLNLLPFGMLNMTLFRIGLFNLASNIRS